MAVVKVQLAFYEQLGIGGLHAYRDTVELAHEAGLLVIADAKRNDVPSTAAAYASAFLGRPRSRTARGLRGRRPHREPVLGAGQRATVPRRGHRDGKGIFVLVRTSNAGAADLQDLVCQRSPACTPTSPTWQAPLGEAHIGASGFAPVGAVVGCTNEAAASSIR